MIITCSSTYHVMISKKPLPVRGGLSALLFETLLKRPLTLSLPTGGLLPLAVASLGKSLYERRCKISSLFFYLQILRRIFVYFNKIV